jgi:putative transposase
MVDWPHAPLHRFGEAGVYFVTGATYQKQHFYPDGEQLDLLQHLLFAKAQQHRCSLQAWALFPNHYHLVVSADDGLAVRKLITRFHSEAALDANRRDQTKGRKVWFQCRETRLTFERSWLARLRYTHENAVHHGIVADAQTYRWCSASWFAATARSAFVETVRRIRIDRVQVYDEY